MNKIVHMAVFAKHPDCDKEFIFAVPCYLDVKKDDLLLVDTMYGPKIAFATSDIFEGKNLNEIAGKYGAYLPLKEVKQVASKEICMYIEQSTKEHIFKTINDALSGICDTALPF